jgi:pilus assembly protein CpaD
MPLNPSQRIRLAALALATLPLGACMADRSVTGSTYPMDVRERHPIVLSDAPRSIDVFATGPALDPRQREDLRAFVADYRRSARGPLSIQVPAGTPGAHRTLEGVRSVLAEAGLSGAVATSSYAPADPRLASPIRLSFPALKAGVPSKCGLWPQDLGISDVGFNNRNEPFWNYGCAMQTNVAAQIDDPVDLVRGRVESRPDTLRRARDIENIRQGKDPSTQYRQDGKGQINRVVGN